MKRQFQFSVTLEGTKLIIDLPAALIESLEKSPAVKRGVSSVQRPSSIGQSAGNFTEREFVAQKRPRGHGEIVAVLAYCLREAGAREFKAEDLKRAYIRAGVRPPKVVSQALRDAKNKYDLIESGSKPSTFRLSPHGERTVLFDLPRANKSLD